MTNRVKIHSGGVNAEGCVYENEPVEIEADRDWFERMVKSVSTVGGPSVYAPDGPHTMLVSRVFYEILQDELQRLSK